MCVCAKNHGRIREPRGVVKAKSRLNLLELVFSYFSFNQIVTIFFLFFFYFLESIVNTDGFFFFFSFWFNQVRQLSHLQLSGSAVL